MNQPLMDPADFRERMNDSFGSEPLHAPAGDDVRRGRKRLRRRRVVATMGAAAAAAAVVTGGSVVQGVGLGENGDAGYASAGTRSAAEVVADCLSSGNYVTEEQGQGITPARLRERMGAARMVTMAATQERTVATLVSEDGAHWADCQLANALENGVKDHLAVYSTDVTFPRDVVSGVTAYEAPYVTDPRPDGTATVSVPDLEVPCVSPLTDEERWAVDAECPEFTMTWNDRRPAEVAAVKVVTPDGKASWADVREGYLSFAYTGDMTPEIAAEVARGEAPGAKRVVFYDAAGEVIVDDRDPGEVPGRGELSILSFPSLAWWLR